MDIAEHKPTESEPGAGIAKLQSLQEQLKRQNDELLTSQAELTRERERYQELFEFAPDSYLVTDAETVIQEANRAASVFLHESRDQLIGRSLQDFISPQEQAKFQQLLERVKRGETIWSWELEISLGEDQLIPITLVAVAHIDDAGQTQVVRWLLHDITDYKRAELALQRQTALVKLLQEVAVASNEASSIAEALQTVINKVCAFTGWVVGHAFLRSAIDPQVLESTHIWYLQDPTQMDVFRKGTESRQFASSEGLPGLVFRTGAPYWISDINENRFFQRIEYAKRSGLRMGLAFPILAGKDVVGVVEFFGQQPVEPDENLLEVIAQIGTQLGRVVEREEAAAELAELQRRLLENREEERLNLSKQLHEGAVQDLYGLSYQLNLLSHDLPETVNPALEEILSSLQGVINTLRTISGELRPPTLMPFGLAKAIRSHSAVIQELHPDLLVSLELMPDGLSLPENIRSLLFRIYQQALNNVLLHAQASQVSIRLVLEPQQVILEIQDDGVGFTLPKRWIKLAREGRLGLVDAAERAETAGGKLKVETAPGMGTLVRANVPLQTSSLINSEEGVEKTPL